MEDDLLGQVGGLAAGGDGVDRLLDHAAGADAGRVFLAGDFDVERDFDDFVAGDGAEVGVEDFVLVGAVLDGFEKDVHLFAADVEIDDALAGFQQGEEVLEDDGDVDVFLEAFPVDDAGDFALFPEGEGDVFAGTLTLFHCECACHGAAPFSYGKTFVSPVVTPRRVDPEPVLRFAGKNKIPQQALTQ